MSNKSELQMVVYAMRGLVAESEAEEEYQAVISELNAVFEKYSKGNEKEQVGFMAAFTTFTLEVGDKLQALG